jgi:hypothetical protein
MRLRISCVANPARDALEKTDAAARLALRMRRGGVDPGLVFHVPGRPIPMLAEGGKIAGLGHAPALAADLGRRLRRKSRL